MMRYGNGARSSRKLLLWPAAAVFIGALIAVNPFLHPQISLRVGIAASATDFALALVLAARQFTTRIGVIVSGTSLSIPFFLSGTPLARFALMVFLAFPFVIATAPLFAPPTAGYQERLAFLFSWLGTKQMISRTRSFDAKSLLRFILATALFTAALYVVKTASGPGIAILASWLALGIAMLALAEMITASHDFLTAMMGFIGPSLMRSPVLSTSVNEFWTRRWNMASSELGFRALCFKPLARNGIVLGLFAAFFASAVAHMLLCLLALDRWGISLVNGAFFLVQPLLILAERRMNVRRWPRASARVWTWTALTLTFPLFAEPVIQIITPTLRASSLLTLIIIVVGFTICGNLFFSLGTFLFCPKVASPDARPRVNSRATVLPGN